MAIGQITILIEVCITQIKTFHEIKGNISDLTVLRHKQNLGCTTSLGCFSHRSHLSSSATLRKKAWIQIKLMELECYLDILQAEFSDKSGRLLPV